MLFCFSSFATECLLLTQTSSKCRQEKQPHGNGPGRRGEPTRQVHCLLQPAGHQSLLLPSSLPADCKLSGQEILFWYFYPQHPASRLARSRWLIGVGWISKWLNGPITESQVEDLLDSIWRRTKTLDQSIFSIFNKYFFHNLVCTGTVLGTGDTANNKIGKNPFPHEVYILIWDVLIEVLFYMAGQMASYLTLGKCFNFYLPDPSLLNGV